MPLPDDAKCPKRHDLLCANPPACSPQLCIRTHPEFYRNLGRETVGRNAGD